MIHATIFDTAENRSFWKKLSESNLKLTFADKFSDIVICDIIIIANSCTDSRAFDILKFAKSSQSFKKIPVAILSSSAETKRQIELLDMGFDDVWTLPMCGDIFMKRIDGLTAAFGKEQLSFENLLAITDDGRRGAYCVPSCDFPNIYKFVLRMLQRVRKNAQLLRMTLVTDQNMSEQSINDVMFTLTRAVTSCLRRGDIISTCDKNQIIVLLIGANDEGGHLVASRIVSSFYGRCSDSSFEITYDIQEVVPNE